MEVNYTPLPLPALSDLSCLASLHVLSSFFTLSLSPSLFLSPPFPSLSSLSFSLFFNICFTNDAQYCYIFAGCCERMSRQPSVKLQHYKRYITFLHAPACNMQQELFMYLSSPSPYSPSLFSPSHLPSLHLLSRPLVSLFLIFLPLLFLLPPPFSSPSPSPPSISPLLPISPHLTLTSFPQWFQMIFILASLSQTKTPLVRLLLSAPSQQIWLHPTLQASWRYS